MFISTVVSLLVLSPAMLVSAAQQPPDATDTVRVELLGPDLSENGTEPWDIRLELFTDLRKEGNRVVLPGGYMYFGPTNGPNSTEATREFCMYTLNRQTKRTGDFGPNESIEDCPMLSDRCRDSLLSLAATTGFSQETCDLSVTEVCRDYLDADEYIGTRIAINAIDRAERPGFVGFWEPEPAEEGSELANKTWRKLARKWHMALISTVQNSTLPREEQRVQTILKCLRASEFTEGTVNPFGSGGPGALTMQMLGLFGAVALSMFIVSC